MKRLIMAAILFIAGFSTFADDMYENAQRLYRNKDNEAAIQLFIDFIDSNPESQKVDDAYWYLGRLHARLNQPDLAESFFLRVARDSNSNRQPEALSDLAKILDKTNQEELLVELFRPIFKSKPDDLYTYKSLKIILKAYYLSGLRLKHQKNGFSVLKYWQEAISVIEYYKTVIDEEYLYNREIKLFIKIASLGYDSSAYIEKARARIAEYKLLHPDDAEKIAQLENELAEAFKTASAFNMKVESAGGYNSMVESFMYKGLARVKHSSLIGELPFSWVLLYEYENLHFKPGLFNFNETGNNRYFDQRHKIGVTAKLKSGSDYFTQSIFSGNATFIHFPASSGTSLDTDLEWTIKHSTDFNTNLGLNTQAGIKLYPLYTSENMDHFSISAGPFADFILSEAMNIELSYDFNFKQYLNSKYQTSSGQSSFDRQYFTQSIDSKIKANYGYISLKLGYQFKYLTTAHYDVLVDGLPAPVFIPSYFDNLSHTSRADIGLNLDTIEIDLSVKYETRFFLNYPARDENQTFINESRNDRKLNIGAELVYNLPFDGFSLFINGNFENSISNMTYQGAILANYSLITSTLGVQWNN